jgi:AcrR family transcriptional regulator
MIDILGNIQYETYRIVKFKSIFDVAFCLSWRGSDPGRTALEKPGPYAMPGGFACGPVPASTWARSWPLPVGAVMSAIKKSIPLGTKATPKNHRPGRPRSTKSQEAILAAALKIFHEGGYRSVTIDGIALEAGVGKQTIYRWWRSKAEVILEAFARHTAGRIAIPDSGRVQSDLQAFLTQVFDNLNRESGTIVRGLMSEALVDPKFAESMRAIFIDSRRSALREILLKGITRGELAPDVEIELIIDLIYGPMWYRLLIEHAPLDQGFARQIAEMICDRLARSA